jgi:hypothetical protein
VARDIDSGFSAAQKAVMMAAGPPEGWAEHSALIARTLVYPQAGHGALDDRTLAADAQAARQQLAQAGYALAGVLNVVFK